MFNNKINWYRKHLDWSCTYRKCMLHIQMHHFYFPVRGCKRYLYYQRIGQHYLRIINIWISSSFVFRDYFFLFERWMRIVLVVWWEQVKQKYKNKLHYHGCQWKLLKAKYDCVNEILFFFFFFHVKRFSLVWHPITYENKVFLEITENRNYQ